MDFITGNLNKTPKKKGWIVGHFMDKGSPLKTENVEVKWITHKKGEAKKGALAKNQTHTLVILIKGKFAVKFYNSKKVFVLNKEGDYLYYDASRDSHEGKALEDTVAIAIRWPSLPNNFM